MRVIRSRKVSIYVRSVLVKLIIMQINTRVIALVSRPALAQLRIIITHP